MQSWSNRGIEVLDLALPLTPTQYLTHAAGISFHVCERRAASHSQIPLRRICARVINLLLCGPEFFRSRFSENVTSIGDRHQPIRGAVLKRRWRAHSIAAILGRLHHMFSPPHERHSRS
jgi:hypothetical protein